MTHRANRTISILDIGTLSQWGYYRIL